MNHMMVMMMMKVQIMRLLKLTCTEIMLLSLKEHSVENGDSESSEEEGESYQVEEVAEDSDEENECNGVREEDEGNVELVVN